MGRRAHGYVFLGYVDAYGEALVVNVGEVVLSFLRVFVRNVEANVVDAAGICTFLNFMGSWTAWGNHTGCYPKSTDVKDYFIPISRMFDYVSNTLIKTFWSKLDKPMNRRLIDTIVDSASVWHWYRYCCPRRRSCYWTSLPTIWTIPCLTGWRISCAAAKAL